MDLLQHTVKLNGVGQAITATQLKKSGKIYLYEREDDNYEVFIAKIAPAGKVFDVEYPEREVYPNNEDFGSIAWAYKNKDLAIKKFDKLVLKNKSKSKSK